MRIPQDVITIDGPAGAGKTTLGHWIADQLGWNYLETGLLYRAAAHVLITDASTRRQEPGAHLLAGVRVRPRRPCPAPRPQQLLLAGQLIPMQRLRSEAVDRLVTQVASAPPVRQAVDALCRDVIGSGPCVVVGRDAASSVAPGARLKLVLEAPEDVLAARLRFPDSPRVRQERRLLEMTRAGVGDVVLIDTGPLSIRQVQQVVAPLVSSFACRHAG